MSRRDFEIVRTYLWSAWREGHDANEALDRIEAENARLRKALVQIRDADFRGNACPDSDIARAALEESE